MKLQKLKLCELQICCFLGFGLFAFQGLAFSDKVHPPFIFCDCAELAETACHGAIPVIRHLYELSHQIIMLCYQARY